MDLEVLAPVPATGLTPKAYAQLIEALLICQPKERMSPAARVCAAVVALRVREKARVVVSDR